MEEETLYDEFGNYIGPALDSDAEEEEGVQEEEARAHGRAASNPKT
jgi:hypothetical protein